MEKTRNIWKIYLYMSDIKKLTEWEEVEEGKGGGGEYFSIVK